MKKGVMRFGVAYEVFNAFNLLFLVVLALLCLLPLVNILSISLSNATNAAAGDVTLWPVKFTWSAYIVAFSNRFFWSSMRISLERVVLGTALTMVMNIITAYPLSRDSSYFRARRYWIWYFFFPTLFGGGLIPTFLIVKFTGLYDTIWALIVPGCAGIWNCILMLNFFRQLPKELEEAAFMDGAGHLKVLMNVIVPVSKPVLATVMLFTMVGHWNDWFGAYVYASKPQNYPLQTYLMSLLNLDVTRVTDFKQRQLLERMSPKTLRAAMVFITALPILLVYPFLQKYFAKGLVLGSVKG